MLVGRKKKYVLKTFAGSLWPCWRSEINFVPDSFAVSLFGNMIGIDEKYSWSPKFTRYKELFGC